MKRRMLAMILLLSMTMGITACGQTGEPVEAGKILSVQVGPDPETMDPALNSTSDGGTMLLHTFERLLSIDENNRLVGGQAESWEVSEDGLVWTFHLRDSLRWSDGAELTADDFVYSFQRVCDPMVAAPYAETVLGMVAGYEEAIAGNLDALQVAAPDARTLVVTLSEPCAFFGNLVAFTTLSPVRKETVEQNGDAWATAAETYITNGPFYISEWVPGSHIIMSKNPYYWNADAIKLDGIKWNLMEDANAAYSAYRTGEVLMIKDVPTEEIPTLSSQSDYHVEPLIGTYYLSLNLEREPFKDKNVRKALSLAIDREYVADVLMQGTYSAAGNYLGPGWTDTDGSEFMDKANGGVPYIDTAGHEANVEEAKRLLKEAGYPDGEGFPVITYSTNDSGYHKVVAEYLQQAFAEIGITLEVEIVEWASFTPMRRNGEYDIARNGWVGDYSDPSNMLDLFYSTNGNNDGMYHSAEFDAAMELSRATLDASERSLALHRAEDILMSDAACIPIAYYNDFWLQSEKITGAWHSPYGHWYFMYADIAE